MKQPFVPLTLVFCSGIIAGAYFKVPFFALYPATLILLTLAVACIRQEKKSGFFILSTAFVLGAAFLRNSQTLPNCHITKLIPYKSESVALMGVIDNDPVYQGKNVSFVLETEKIGIGDFWKNACGKVLVKVLRKEDFSYGDRLLIKGSIYRPFSFSEGFNYREYLKHQYIFLIFSGGKGGCFVKRLNKDAGNFVKAFSFKIKHKLREAIVKNLSPFSAGILNALILGDRQDLPAYLLDILMKLGTIHIIAISGFNVGIVAFVISLILKITKVPRKPRYLLTMLLLFVYSILTGASAPVLRATVMAAVFLCAYFFEREADICNSLALTTMAMLAFNPWQLFEISFQLSFLSVASIVLLAPKIESVFPENLRKIRWVRFLILTFSVSSAAWIGLMPLIAYYFKTFTTVTVLANMIIVPYSAVITATGFCFALASILFPFLAPSFAATNEALIAVLFKIHYFLVNIPGAYFKLPEVPFAYIALYYFLLMLVVNSSKIYTFIKQGHSFAKI